MNGTGWDTNLSSFGGRSDAGTISALGRTNYLGVAGYGGNGEAWGVSTTNAPRLGVPAGTPVTNFEGVYATRSKTRTSNITDGTSNTLLFGEVMGGRVNMRPEASFTWMGCGFLATYNGLTDTNGKPQRIWGSFNSEHPGMVQFAVADASVKKLNLQVNYGVYITLSGMRDGMNTAGGSEALQ
jgi:hypothetical protein